MKQRILYLTALIMAFAIGCTDFGSETQLSFPDGPDVTISNVVAGEGGESITFTVAPTGEAAFYSWIVVQADEPDLELNPNNVLRLNVDGVESATVEYKKDNTKTVTVEDLLPNTRYQIYAVSSSVNGMVGKVANSQILTTDDGGLPGPQTFEVEDSTIAINFNEPIVKGNGKVYLSYFAKHSVIQKSEGEGDDEVKYLELKPGHEAYNKQDIVIDEDDIKVAGNQLIVTVSDGIPGAFANITFDADAVKDLDGNGCKAFKSKPTVIEDGVIEGGATFRLPTKEWDIKDEFTKDEDDDDVVASSQNDEEDDGDEEDEIKFPIPFVDWTDLTIIALSVEEEVNIVKIDKNVPTFTYVSNNKEVNVKSRDWGVSQDGIMYANMPEAPDYGATVNLEFPKGSFEDVYGNVNTKLEIKGKYLRSYGYTVDDIAGVYRVIVDSNWDGVYLKSDNIVIEPTEKENEVLIKNFFDYIAPTAIKATLDPVFGTLSAVEDQLILENIGFQDGSFRNFYFSSGAGEDIVVFDVPEPGLITSNRQEQIWGFFLTLTDGEELGWWDAFLASEWQRTSTELPEPPAEPATKEPVALEYHKGPRNILK